MGSNPVAVTSPSDFAPASSKEFLDIQATIECGFTLKRVRDMIKTYILENIALFVKWNKQKERACWEMYFCDIESLKDNVMKDLTINFINALISQPAITCSKLTIKTLEQGVKYVQS